MSTKKTRTTFDTVKAVVCVCVLSGFILSTSSYSVNVSACVFDDGRMETVKCQINNSILNTGNCPLSNMPIEYLEIVLTTNSKTTKLCTFRSFLNCTLFSQDSIANSCGCYHEGNNIYNVNVTVTADRNTFDGAIIDCHPNCIDSNGNYPFQSTYNGIPIAYVVSPVDTGQSTTTASITTRTQGIQLNECSSSGWIQVEEGSHNILLLTCSGLESTDAVSWNLNLTAIGSCQPGPGNCVTMFSTFKVERPVNEYSKLSLVRPATKELLDAKTISCHITANNTEKCKIDFIIRAKEIACNANFQPGTWNVTTACNISNFYSTQGNYTCVWKEWISNTPTQIDSRFVNLESIVSSSNSSYNRATCKMNKQLPDVDGEYNYTMKFSPVAEDVNANFFTNNTIYRPKYRPTMNCTNSTYVVEGKRLVCTCDASDLGQPPGRLLLHWNNSVIYGNYSIRNVLQRFDIVTRQHDGNILRCALDWATMSTGELNVSYTFNVAYGPDYVSILGPVDFEVHPYLTRQLSLSCVHSDAKPYVTYQWSGLCINQINNHCNFTPTVANDGQTVICTLFNSLAGVTKNASFQLTLQYPPPIPPDITGYLGEPLYSDQPKTIFCNVSGGKPPVSNVTFNCQGQSYTNNGQGISIQLLPNASYNGKNCTCRSFWKHPDWYTSSATVTLLVYYPPQKPAITVKNQIYPFMEGQSATLFCQFTNGTDRGNPLAQLTWQRYQRSDVDNELILSLHPLTIGDNGRNIQCFAVNHFTEVKNMVIDTNFTIQVYYHPILSLNESQGTKCLNNSLPWMCIVEDGERININCFARSNPTPKSIVWQVFRPDLPDRGQGGNLLIESANHSIHTGIYVCNVTTEDLGGNDSRLPLSSTEELHIIVKYAPDQINMSVNSILGNISVQENDALTFDCHANGRPTPKLLLFEKNNLSQPIFEVRGGILNVGAEDSVLSYNLPSVRCNTTAIYICTATNYDGASSISAMVQVFVMCQPQYTGIDFPIMDYVGYTVSLTFGFVAYPAPKFHNITFLGPSQNTLSPGDTMKDIIFIVDCWAPDEPYNIYCNLTTKNISSKSQEGYYRFLIANEYGSETVDFQLKINASKNNKDNDGNSSSTAAIAGGVCSAIIVIAIIVVVSVILKRRKRVKGMDNSSNSERLDNSNLTMSGNQGKSHLDPTTIWEERPNNSEYDSLRVDEIGLVSTYESMKQETKPKPQNGEKLSSYEKLETSDIGVVSHYDNIQQSSSFNVIHSTGPDYANC